MVNVSDMRGGEAWEGSSELHLPTTVARAEPTEPGTPRAVLGAFTYPEPHTVSVRSFFQVTSGAPVVR